MYMAKGRFKCYGPNCYKQGIWHSKDELTEFQDKNYCDECLNEVMAEYEYRQSFKRMLADDYGTCMLPPIVNNQITKYRKLGMTYEGMYRTAMGLKKEKGTVFEKKYGIALIKYHYDSYAHYDESNQKDDQTIVRKAFIVIPKPQRRHKQIEEIKGDDLFD